MAVHSSSYDAFLTEDCALIFRTINNMYFYPTYFSPIAQFAAMTTAEQITFEVCDNYQKQTYRTRSYIYSPNGRQRLNVPIQHTGGRQKTRDVKIDHSENWQIQHKKSLEAAYRSSPFFEFYEDEITAIFKRKHIFLLDLNIKTYDLICNIFEWDKKVAKTKIYKKSYPDGKDFRSMVDAKTRRDLNLEPYAQVFSERHGFLPNLSILDLLFNLGPETEGYLKKQNLEAF